MAEIDPVILEIRADMGRYRAELRTATAIAEASFERQRRDIQRLERQIRASTANISGTLRGLGTALGGAFSAQQVANLIDSYTRFQNQLRVAGVEGDNLARVQERLLEVAQRYGVELETLGNLYGGAAQAQRDLGASQGQILQLAESTAQALKITGKSTIEARGAILGLTQALASGIVRAEEFNQINEGGLRPLLQAAAAGERFGGSVAKLRIAVADGKVTSQEFFAAVMNGAKQLEGQAAKATLTLSGAFTKLTNALTVYIGESAQANGVTGALAGAMELLANNLDTVADALAVIATILVGRYVAGAVAAAGATGVVSSAIFAMQARALGAATTMEALGFAGAAAGRTLLAAFGGPIGLAVTALAIGIGYVVTASSAAAKAARVYEEAQRIAGETTKRAADAAERLASAHGKAREEALKAAKAEYELVKQKLASAQASALLASAEYSRLRASVAAGKGPGAASSFGAPSYVGGAVRGITDDAALRKAEERMNAADKAAVDLFKSLTKLGAAIAAPDVTAPSVSTADKKKKKTGHTGKSADEITAAYERDLAQILRDELQARLAITTDAEDRATIQGQLLQLDYEQRLAEINANKDYSEARKKALKAQLDKLYGIGPGGETLVNNPQGIAIRREAEDRLRQQAEQNLEIERDALAAQADLIDNRELRLAIERRILELAQEEERSRLEAAIAAGEIADATKARADQQTKHAAERAGLDRRFESPFDRYARSFDNVGDQVEEAVVRRLEEVDDGITDAISKAIGVKDPLIKSLLDILIQQVLLKPIAEALSGADGGGGGIAGVISAGIGALFGRASGGYVPPNSVRRVNEGSGRVELLSMGSKGGHVIPLGQTRAASPGAQTVVQHITVDARNSVNPSGFAREILAQANGFAVEVGKRSVTASRQLVPQDIAKQNRYGTR